MHSLRAVSVLILSLLPLIDCASDSTTPLKSCSLNSPSTGSFYNLEPLLLTRDGTKEQVATNESFHAKGYDYPANFTLNFCGPVVEQLVDVNGISKSLWQNISAFYRNTKGEAFSIGQQNDRPVFRGKKLILNYTMGSPCPDLDENGSPIENAKLKRWPLNEVEMGLPRVDEVYQDTHGEPTSPQGINTPSAPSRRKSTLISFICDTSPLYSTHPSIAFLGSPDHCSYVFEVRSRSACAGVTVSPEKGNLGPGGVFAVIFGIALLAYLIGGVVYQRNVMHQRGWKQLPNYSVWAGIFGFFSDIFVILFSSCTRRMPNVTGLFAGRRGYHRVGTDRSGPGGPGRGSLPEDENRLIDQLDEEWED